MAGAKLLRPREENRGACFPCPEVFQGMFQLAARANARETKIRCNCHSSPLSKS
jgi:hypothetical protein